LLIADIIWLSLIYHKLSLLSLQSPNLIRLESPLSILIHCDDFLLRIRYLGYCGIILKFLLHSYGIPHQSPFSYPQSPFSSVYSTLIQLEQHLYPCLTNIVEHVKSLYSLGSNNAGWIPNVPSKHLFLNSYEHILPFLTVNNSLVTEKLEFVLPHGLIPKRS